jgi:hypothetical protein
MKFESDTEIDRLLRRHARRTATAASTAAENARSASDDESTALPGAGGVHMDTDELNAYAEGALPDASRARYAPHLADCDRCRSLVVKLTLAANVATAPNAQHTTAAVSPSRSWREWLAALFSPPALRYGVPAFALLAVIAVALIATREQRKVDLVAQNEQTQTSSVRPPINQEEQQAHTPPTGTSTADGEGTSLNANSGAGVNNPRQANTAAGPSTAQPKDGTAEQPGTPVWQNEPKPAGQSRESGGLLGSATADRSDRDEAATMAKPQQSPPPPVATVPAAKAPAESDATVSEEVTQKSAGGLGRNKTATPAPGTRNNNYAVDGVESRAQTDDKRETESGRRAGTAARSRKSADRQPSNEAVGRVGKDDGTAETRSAGGRHFRRQGGAWVDTAYNASRSTISIARGSEQYRALTADEPGIRAIADQLGGTIILVWKNRAYRIY